MLWTDSRHTISIYSVNQTVLEVNCLGKTIKKPLYNIVHTVPPKRSALRVLQHQCCFSGRPPTNWVHSQNRKRTGYWLRSTPKWVLWFSAVSHQLSEQCAANKKHFINIPSDRSLLPVNIVPRRILAPQKIVHSGSSWLQLLGHCWIKWKATGHVTMLTSMCFLFFCLVICFCNVHFYVRGVAVRCLKLMCTCQIDAWKKYAECFMSVYTISF